MRIDATYDSFADLLAKTGNNNYPLFLQKIRDKVSYLFFIIASYLTDPVCKCHELFRSIYVVDSLNPTAWKITNFVRKIFFVIAIAGYAHLAVITTLPGIFLRYLAIKLQTKEYSFFSDEKKEKQLSKDKKFSLYSWNVCGVHGGYTISDGGVVPWQERLDRIIDHILKADADVNCIFEVFDIKMAAYMMKRLKKAGYVDFCFNIRAQAVGVSAAMFVASKYRVKNIAFALFPEEMLDGRTKLATKGILSFDLALSGKSFAKVYATHLQHSEEPSFPTEEEKEARKKEIKLLQQIISFDSRDICTVVTGDLNLDEKEYRTSSWQQQFKRDISCQLPTWGGDGYCAQIVGKRVSNPCNLDYTLLLKERNDQINSHVTEAGYISTIFSHLALSDHNGVFSQIAVS